MLENGSDWIFFIWSEIFRFPKSLEVFVLVKVVLRNGESEQKLFRRFRKTVVSSGVMGEVRKRRWFISKNEQRRIDKKKAIRRLKQRKNKNSNQSRRRY